MKRVAIIGAGVAGLALARFLQPHCNVTLFDKSRGVGGRMATRRTDGYEFDHGAQYFTAKTDSFRKFLSPMLKSGVVDRWTPTVLHIDEDGKQKTRHWADDVPRYVAAPGMRSLCKYLAKAQTVQLKTRIVTIRKSGTTWQLEDETGKAFDGFDWVICTAPAPQTAVLMPHEFVHNNVLDSIKMSACHTLMLGFEFPLELSWQAARVEGADISWIAVNNDKPGRPQRFSLVIHASNPWSDSHIDDELDACQSVLISKASQIIGHDLTNADHTVLHRWRYANVDKQPHKILLDEQNQLAACGDWCVEGRVEGAFASALSLFEELQPLLKK